MSVRDAITGFWLGLRKGPVIAVNNGGPAGMTGAMIAVNPVNSAIDVVNTLQSPTSSNVPTRWSGSFMGPGQPFAGAMDTRSQDAEKEPRTMQYIANVNATIAPRISWGLTAFSELRNAAENVPEVAGVITLITDELKAFNPCIVDMDDKDVEEGAYPGLEWMIEQPDRVNPWSVWLSRLVYNIVAYDAPAVYKIRDDDEIVYQKLQKVELVNSVPDDTDLPASALLRWVCSCGSSNYFPMSANIRKNFSAPVVCDVCQKPASPKIMNQLLGNTVTKSTGLPPVVGLRIIDGSTLFVLIDERGESPEPPAPAYTQVIWGTPRMFLNKNQLWYRPRYLRADAPYGRSFIESSMASVKLLSNLWAYEGAKYQSGNLPEMGMECPPTWTDADQILNYEDAYNARMAGSPEERGGRMRFFPNGMKSIVVKDVEFNKEAYDVAVNTIRMAAGIPKSEAGEAPEGMLGGKGFSEAMQSAFYRMCLAPMIAFVEGLFNDILRENGYYKLRFKLRFPSDSIDPETEETKWSTRFQVGGITRDEYRQGLGMKALGGEEGKFLVNPGGGQGEEGADAGGPLSGPVGVKKPGMIGVSKPPVQVLKKPVAVLKKPVSVKKALFAALDTLCPDWADPVEFAAGMAVEQEHADVTNGDLSATAEIVLAHLRETPDYYTRLGRMEAEAEAAGTEQLEKRTPEHDGIMVAIPVPGALEALGGLQWPLDAELLPENELHVTLAYLGDIQEQDTGKDRLYAAIEQFASTWPAFDGKLNGVGRFTETHKEGKECLWLNFDAPALATMRDALITFLAQNEFHDNRDHGFTPHVTLAYYNSGDAPDLSAATVDSSPVTINVIRVAWGDEVKDFPLGGGKVEKDAGAAPTGISTENAPNGVYLVGQEEESSSEKEALSKFAKLDFAKHCGTCAEDDQYFGASIRQRLTDPALPHGANGAQLVSIGAANLEDRPAVWKPESSTKPGLADWAGGPLHLREEAAFLLDRELAESKDKYLVPVTWADTLDGQPGSVQHYVRGAMPKKDLDEYGSLWVERAAVLDYVAGQMDRVKKNYLTHPEDPARPVLIDNNISFSPDPARELRSDFVSYMQGKPLSEETYEQLHLLIGNRALWDDLRECLQDEIAVANAKARAQTLYDDQGFATNEPPDEGRLVKGEWEEDKHPRAEDGKFGSGGEGTEMPVVQTAPDKKLESTAPTTRSPKGEASGGKKRVISGKKYDTAKVVNDAIESVKSKENNTQLAYSRRVARSKLPKDSTDDQVEDYAVEMYILTIIGRETGSNAQMQQGKWDFSSADSIHESLNDYLDRRIGGQHRRYAQQYGKTDMPALDTDGKPETEDV